MKPRRRPAKPWYKRSPQEFDRELAALSVADRMVCSPPPRNGTMDWFSLTGPKRSRSIRILTAPRFSIRGMRFVYGRGDFFHRLSRGLSIYLRKDGRVFFQFESPGKRVTYRSYELLGIEPPPLLVGDKSVADDFVPEIVRDLYEEWVIECLEYPDVSD